jgi:ADP-ribose pyrophosphatase YjhB (NUDIX family)
MGRLDRLDTMRGKKFRVSARVIFSKGDKILATEAKSSTKDSRFFIVPGGTMEFGESSKTTLTREIDEELHAKMKNIKYIGVIESLFKYKGERCHEFLFIYSAQFSDSSFYKKSVIKGMEDTGKKFTCTWMKISDFEKGKYLLVPVGILKLLKGKNAKEKHLIRYE